MATGAGGSVSQAFTITANDLIQYSLFARKSASQFVSLTLSNGVNPCAVWFDLNQGVVGGNTPGGGSCVFSGAAIEAWPGGWFRCTMSVSTNASTNFTAAFQPASANNASTATNDAVMAWGASLSHGVTGAFYGRTPAYIQTAAAQGSRANEISQFILPDANFDPNQGTFFVHYTVPVASGQAGWTGGSGNTINDYISLRHSVRLDGGASNIFGTIVAGGVQVALAQDTTSGIGFETPIRAAFAYKQGDVAAFCVNGRPVVQSSIPAAWPAAPARIVVGGQPFNQNVLAEIAIRRFAYFPRKLTNAQLIKLTT
jgi:hypothetical protein